MLTIVLSELDFEIHLNSLLWCGQERPSDTVIISSPYRGAWANPEPSDTVLCFYCFRMTHEDVCRRRMAVSEMVMSTDGQMNHSGWIFVIGRRVADSSIYDHQGRYDSSASPEHDRHFSVGHCLNVIRYFK